MLERAKRRHLHQLKVLALALFVIDAMQVGVEIKIFLDAQILVQAESLRHIADAVLHFLRMGRDVEAEHMKLALVRDEQTGGQTNQRDLAGPTGANQCSQSARAYLERDATERLNFLARWTAEALAQTAADQRCGIRDH
jgi:hypothetical protein